MKTLVLVTVAVALLVCAGTFYVRSDVSPAIYLDDHPAQAYYTVKTDGTNVWAVAATGEIVFDDTTANTHTVINNAINGLTSGRAFKEKVALRGSFTISSSIIIKSYLVLDCREAKITCSSSINALDTSGTTTHVDIIGGHWVGASATSGRFCDLTTATYILVQECTISTFYKGFELTSSCYYIVIDHNNFKSPMGTSSAGSALYLNGAHDVSFTNNIVTAGGNGVQCDGYAAAYYNIKVIGNDLSGWVGNQNHAVYFDATGSGGYGCQVKDNNIHDRGADGGPAFLIKSPEHELSYNTFKGLDGWGIQISGQYSGASRNRVFRNDFYDCTNMYGGCISLGAVSGTPQAESLLWNEIAYNSFYDCRVGISLGGNATGNAYTDYTQIHHNRWTVSTGAGTTEAIVIEDAADVRYTEIYWNHFYNLTTQVSGTGVSTEIRWNEGYNTEASSSALNTTATTFVIAHGLVTTPIIVLASFNATEVASWKWTADATDITITMTGTLAGNVTAYWEARTWHYP